MNQRPVGVAALEGVRVAEWLGEPVPIQAVASMLMISAPMPRLVHPIVGATGRTLSFEQDANGSVMIGGGMLGRADPETNAHARTIAATSPAADGSSTHEAWPRWATPTLGDYTADHACTSISTRAPP